MNALREAPFTGVEADILVGANSSRADAVGKNAATRAGTRIHRNVTDMATLMSRADLAVGAGGTTTLERLCVGLPSIVVSIAENQRPACEALAHDGLIFHLRGDCGTAPDIGGALRHCAAAPAALADMSARSRLAVDGLGAARMLEMLVPTAIQDLHLRPAGRADAAQYFSWVNDPEVRRQSMDPNPVAWPQHQEWFAGKLANDSSHLYVLTARALPVGQVRFDWVNGEFAIDYSVDPAFRGRGWGRRIVELGLESISNAQHSAFRAEVRDGNAPSAAVFRKLGFVESGSMRGRGTRLFRREA